MTPKTILYVILGIISFGISLLVKKNKNKSEDTKKKMLDRNQQVKNLEKFKNSTDFKH